MNIRFLGAHNCESESTKCACILIDGTLAIDAGGLTSSLSIPNQQKLKAILLTHQHYDHIRDIPALALNLSLQGASIKVYSTAGVRRTIETHFLNGKVYPKFQEVPETEPTISFNLVTPYEPQRIDGHSILPIPVKHCDASVGYLVSDAKGKTMFYTADTGPGLLECWKQITPQLLIIDVTAPNSYEAFARKTGHLTPDLLGKELLAFRELKGYLPEIIVVHMYALLEKEIRDEIATIARDRNIPITVAYEGMEVNI